LFSLTAGANIINDNDNVTANFKSDIIIFGYFVDPVTPTIILLLRLSCTKGGTRLSDYSLAEIDIRR